MLSDISLHTTHAEIFYLDNSAMPYSEPSLPVPDSFMPPKGAYCNQQQTSDDVAIALLE
jgi:hypothetical protein